MYSSQFSHIVSGVWVRCVRGIIPCVPLIGQEFIKEFHDSSITKALHHHVEDVCQGGLVPDVVRSGAPWRPWTP